MDRRTPGLFSDRRVAGHAIGLPPACRANSRAGGCGVHGSDVRLVLGCRRSAIARARPSRDGGVESAARLASRPRHPEARRKRRRRGDRHGRHAERDRAKHDGNRRRRLHDGLFGEDQETRRFERQRAGAEGVEPGLLRQARVEGGAVHRHGAHHRAGRVRRLGHSAREIRNDEAAGSAGAGDRVCGERVSPRGEDRGGLDGGRAAARGAQVRVSARVSVQRRAANRRDDLRSEEPGSHVQDARQGRARCVLSRRDCEGHRGLLPEERWISDDGGLCGAEIGMGGAHFDDLQGPHLVRNAAQRPGADGAHSCEHSGRHRPEVDAQRSGGVPTTR